MAWWLFQNVVITTALAAMVVVVCRATRIGPVARHALWVLVLVKFVTPPLVVWPWPAPDPLGVAALDLRDAHLVAAGPAAAFDEDSGVAAEPVAVFEVSASRPVPGRADQRDGWRERSFAVLDVRGMGGGKRVSPRARDDAARETRTTGKNRHPGGPGDREAGVGALGASRSSACARADDGWRRGAGRVVSRPAAAAVAIGLVRARRPTRASTACWSTSWRTSSAAIILSAGSSWPPASSGGGIRCSGSFARRSGNRPSSPAMRG